MKRSVSATDWLDLQVAESVGSTTSTDSVPWVESYAPISESDLVIHHSKLRELSTTLQTIFCGAQSKTSPGGPILILTGPPGSGKTNCLRVLLRSPSLIKSTSCVQLIEWDDQSLDPDNFGELEQFVCQVGRYGQICLETGGTIGKVNGPCVVLVKNLPVAIMESVDRFHQLLRTHRTHAQSNCLLVLVISSELSAREGLLSERLLCPVSLRHELNVRRVEFNPVAPSLVLKALGRVLRGRECAHPGSGTIPRTVLQQLANACAGDLRTAINQLQFLMKTGTNKSMQPPRSVDSTNQTCRDVGVLIFRTLGKILHSKRLPAGKTSEKPICQLPHHLASWKRPQLEFELEDVLEQSRMDGDQMINWLHANHLDFAPHMTACQWSSDWISWSDAHLTGGMNWRLGLSAASDWQMDTSSTLSHPRSNGFTSHIRLANLHYAAQVVSRTVLLARDMPEDSETVGSGLGEQRRSMGFHAFKPPSVHDWWRRCAERENAVRDWLTTSGCSQLGHSVIAARKATRSGTILDWVSLGCQIPTLKNCIRSGDFELLQTVAKLKYRGPEGYNSRDNDRYPDGDMKRPFKKTASYQYREATEPELDSWTCPEDAVIEGAALPIEEDLSDEDQCGRGR